MTPPPARFQAKLALSQVRGTRAALTGRRYQGALGFPRQRTGARLWLQSFDRT
jgi:hypothetical protein